jgi:hypothetical protein
MAIELEVIPFQGDGNQPGSSTTSGEQQTEQKEEKLLRYPYKRIEENNHDYLKITVLDYVPGGIGLLDDILGGIQVSTDENDNVTGVNVGNIDFSLPTASRRIANVLAASPPSEKIKKIILLPIPESISDVASVSWGDGSLSPLDAFGVSFGADFINNPSEALSMAFDKLKGTFGNIGNDSQIMQAITAAVSGAAVGSLGGNVSANQLISRATGQVFNPNLELLFDGVGLRTFPFTFEFFPRSKKEAEQVVKILRTFKTSILAKKNAEKKAGITGVFISAPDVFQLQYMRGNKPHPFLNHFQPAALIDMQVNYTGSNTYSTFRDGTPTHMQLTLTFKELNPIYQDDQTALYADESNTSVGY